MLEILVKIDIPEKMGAFDSYFPSYLDLLDTLYIQIMGADVEKKTKHRYTSGSGGKE